jgi:hypothetical protein
MGKNQPGAPGPVTTLGTNPAVNHLHRDLATQHQISTLLSIVDMTSDILIAASREDEDHDKGDAPTENEGTFPGEGAIAVEVTMIKALERIDDILDDKSRWGAAYQAHLENLFNQAHADGHAVATAQQQVAEAQLALQKLQHEAAAIIVAPHYIHKPSVQRLTDTKEWIAFIGDPRDPDASVVGIGTTPEKAMESFDRAFRGNLPRTVEEWLKQGKKYGKENMDGNGNQTTDGPGSPGQEPQGGSVSPG